ncbi:hypothetical protein MTR67_035597 [Solanum verrucosum]|uniref:USP domain-containing protein n=1 Tax=Solanum verrucosum TaxID=315347 RepID=A0AAF0ZKF6_SOLVR|nr:hypothetical protein MTR67_035597 [Solanum verrucosum]
MLAVGGNIQKIMLRASNKGLMSSSFQCWTGSMTKRGKQVWQSKVITHSGMLEFGHYLTYLRLRNQWYKCDDAWITEVDEEVVKASHYYLMYYVQKMLYHKRCEDVSCQPMLLRADTFVLIVGCC